MNNALCFFPMQEAAILLGNLTQLDLNLKLAILVGRGERI
jgi:hypothetical protein